MKNLSDILTGVQTLQVLGDCNREVTGLVYDSRQVAAGSVFFALPGVKVDGYDYIPQAVERGARVVIAERIPQPDAAVTFVQVGNVRQAMALMAANFYGRPTADVPVVGITGTNGKTTISYLLEAILTKAGYRPAIFGTIDYRCGQTRKQSTHTTPESVELLKIMREFRDLGADAFVMETSSHALEQHRVDGVSFDVGVFTNLTPEHLDYHQTLENYFTSKKRLFSELLVGKNAAVNADDSYGLRLLQDNPDWVGFGRYSAAVSAEEVSVTRDGIRGVISTPGGDVRVNSRLIGEFNVSNLMAAVTAAQLLGIDNEMIAAGVAALELVPGRLEAVGNERGVLALVDYAHTGDALEQVLKTLADLEANKRYTVVGCGGDRDPSKRPVMAAIAARYSSLGIFTSDNPRTEDPLQILAQLRAGALAEGYCELNEEQAQAGEPGFIVIPDRRQAIDFACRLCCSGDLLLVAGKGHEDYQILGTEKIHFDDREEISRALTLPSFKGGADV